MAEAQMNEKVDDAIEKLKNNASKLTQFATDAMRILTTGTESLERVQNLGFFERIKDLFSVSEQKQEIANVKVELNELKKFALTALEVMNERNLLTADALITVKNNLNSLVIEQNDIKKAVTVMAQKVSDRFDNLEKRVDELENSGKLNTWLSGIEVDDSYLALPETIRFLKVVRDFYNRKQSNYSRDELLLIRKALKDVKLDYSKKVSLGAVVDSLLTEIPKVGKERYLTITSLKLKNSISQEKVSNILSVPSFIAIQELPESEGKFRSTISLLVNKYKIPYEAALKDVVKFDIEDNNGIDMNYELTLGDLGIELISCYSVIGNLLESDDDSTINEKIKNANMKKILFCPACRAKLEDDSVFCPECGKKIE